MKKNDIVNLLKRKRYLTIWFRDDDVGVFSEKFKNLDNMFRESGLCIYYSVIPNKLDNEVTQIINSNDNASVFQHGYNHDNNSESNLCELCLHPNIDFTINKVLESRSLLQKLFNSKFLNILSPPYNCIDEYCQSKLKDYYQGCSTYKYNKTLFEHMINPNCDIVDWNKECDNQYDYIYNQIEKVQGDCLGILIHHQYFTKETFEIIQEILNFIKHNQINTKIE